MPITIQIILIVMFILIRTEVIRTKNNDVEFNLVVAFVTTIIVLVVLHFF